MRGIALLRAFGEVETEGEHDLGGGGDYLRAAHLRRDRAEHAEDVLRGGAVGQRVGDLPRVRGRGRVERDQRRDLHERERTRIEARRLELRLAQADRPLEHRDVAGGEVPERVVRLLSNSGHEVSSRWVAARRPYATVPTAARVRAPLRRVR